MSKLVRGNEKSFGSIEILIGSDALTANQGSSTQQVSIQCSRELKKQIETILKVPEARNLVAMIQREGHFSISVNNDPLSKQFGAFWDFDDRVVAIHLGAHESEGKIAEKIRSQLILKLPLDYELALVMPCGHSKVKDNYRYQFMIKAVQLNAINGALHHVLHLQALPRSVKMSIDIDPSSTFF